MYKAQMYIQYVNRYVGYWQYFNYMGEISKKNLLGTGCVGRLCDQEKRLENTDLGKE